MKTKQSRRDFLKLSATGALGAFMISKNNWKASVISASDQTADELRKFGIGLQLYTIRDAMGKDVPGSLKKVSDIGFKYLEPASYSNGKFYGYLPGEFKKMINDLGMEVISSHAGVNPQGITTEEAKKMAEDHAKLGAKYCMQPYVADGDRKTIRSEERR